MSRLRLITAIIVTLAVIQLEIIIAAHLAEVVLAVIFIGAIYLMKGR